MFVNHTFRCLIGMLIISFNCPALAEDYFSLGCADYEAANYGKAKEEFLQALKQNPKSWKAQYQLANTFIQMKQNDEGKRAYQKCITLKPDAVTAHRCESAIAVLNAPPPVLPQARPTPPANNSESALPKSQTSSSTNEAAEEARKNAVDARRAVIMADAERQVASIKAEEQRAVEEGNANSNHRWKNYETGERYVKMTAAERSDVEKEYEDRIKRVMDEAHRRAQSVISP